MGLRGAVGPKAAAADPLRFVASGAGARSLATQAAAILQETEDQARRLRDANHKTRNQVGRQSASGCPTGISLIVGRRTTRRSGWGTWRPGAPAARRRSPRPPSTPPTPHRPPLTTTTITTITITNTLQVDKRGRSFERVLVWSAQPLCYSRRWRLVFF